MPLRIRTVANPAPYIADRRAVQRRLGADRKMIKGRCSRRGSVRPRSQNRDNGPYWRPTASFPRSCRGPLRYPEPLRRPSRRWRHMSGLWKAPTGFVDVDLDGLSSFLRRSFVKCHEAAYLRFDPTSGVVSGPSLPRHARPRWRVARIVSLRAFAAGHSSFHGRPSLRIGSEGLTAICTKEGLACYGLPAGNGAVAAVRVTGAAGVHDVTLRSSRSWCIRVSALRSGWLTNSRRWKPLSP
ncbi:hypothetical protein SAMN04487971_110100 [Paracoccus chinensis]|uniref:Uncharacterized protein n=1 Tax=Paracoccus chinensis TaxID=525640 RepID=A0A1G9K0J3_9RHOB|nr:hypothetical protein SAMN04487971_110100 [Paracoccus chinensis]